MGSGDKKGNVKGRLLEELQHPTRLRVALTCAVLLTGYAGVYLPLSSEIDDTARRLAAEQKRLDLARDVERLREQCRAFKGRLPAKADSNEWVQYVIAGIRRFPVKLVLLDPEAPREVGPYKVVVLRVELEGGVRGPSGVRALAGDERAAVPRRCPEAGAAARRGGTRDAANRPGSDGLT